MFDTVIDYIKSNIDSIHYNANIGVVVYNTNVKFLSIPDNLEPNNVKLITCADMNDSFCALSEGELFLNLEKEREKIDLLLDKVKELKDTLDEEASYMSIVGNTTPILRTINDSMRKTGGKALLFCADIPIGGEGALQRTKLDEGKKDDTYRVKVGKIGLIGLE